MSERLARGAQAYLDRERADVILTALRRGHHLETAAALAGYQIRTVRTWLRRGMTGDARYAPFASAVHRAMAEVEDRLLERVVASDDWRAQRWVLGRRFPGHWGEATEAQRQYLLDQLNLMVEVVERHVDPATYRAIEADLFALHGAGGDEEV